MFADIARCMGKAARLSEVLNSGAMARMPAEVSDILKRVLTGSGPQGMAAMTAGIPQMLNKLTAAAQAGSPGAAAQPQLGEISRVLELTMRIQSLKMALMQLEAELDGLLAHAAAPRSSQGRGEDAMAGVMRMMREGRAGGSARTQGPALQLQAKQAEMAQMMTNIMKTMHDAQMSVIRNLK